MAKGTNRNGKRVAVVAGLRTPFAKQATRVQDAAHARSRRAVVTELVQRTEISPKEIGCASTGRSCPRSTG